MPVSRGRKPNRQGRSPHRSGRPGAPRREPDLSTPLLKVLSQVEDPLAAEILLSKTFGMAYESQQYGKQEIVESMAAGLLGAAETSDRPGALELLAALGSVGPDSLAARARAMVDVRLAAKDGLDHQPWVTDLGDVRCTRALALQDAFGDTTQYFTVYERSGEAHALIWLIDNNIPGGYARDVLVGPEVVETERKLRELAAAEDEVAVTVTELDLAVLHGRLRRAMDQETQTLGPPEEESYAASRMLAYGRLRVLPEPVYEDDPAEVDEAERDRIVAGFLQSPERSLYPKDLPPEEDVTFLVRLIVDHALDYVGGSAYRITPGTAEQFLMDWVPRKVVMDADDIELMPIVLGLWAMYASRLEPLGPIDLLTDFIAELAPQFDDLMESGEKANPFSVFLQNAVDAGADISDPAVTQALMDEYNRGLDQA